MPRGPSPGWRQRKEPVVDEWLMAAVEQAGGVGKHDQHGHYAVLVIRGLENREEAAEYKRALFRCALWLTRNGVAELSVSQCDIERDGAAWKLTFRVSDKTHARKFQLETRGADRSRWAYDPRGRVSPT